MLPCDEDALDEVQWPRRGFSCLSIINVGSVAERRDEVA
jgi:hypothetical protein